jgi:hypothetical protein
MWAISRVFTSSAGGGGASSVISCGGGGGGGGGLRRNALLLLPRDGDTPRRDASVTAADASNDNKKKCAHILSNINF